MFQYFQKKATPIKKVKSDVPKVEERVPDVNMSEDELREKIEELKGAKKKYGKFNDLKYIELNDGCMMPALGVGTALVSIIMKISVIYLEYIPYERYL